ncbi:dna replication initiation factor cdc45 [Stemphylium lycopersici]|nr:dna replication initiation factor cdc45 [Stemphylium lycopersici]
MGIQGLARRLEPYATRFSSDELNGYSAVIDGPALAYYAHKLALVAFTSASRIPSYQDINTEAINWLNSLEANNIKVAAIFFDGALPPSKRVERLSRTEQNNKRVQQLRSSYATTTCPVPTYLGSISYAFLAPALQEALQKSPFASRTHIVPGEADDWCALHAKDNAQSIIFTSDTDLVLYDYCADTLIVFLHETDVSVSIKAYSPDQIRTKLELRSLLPFAFALLEGPSDTANDLARNARNVDKNSQPYLDFSNRYITEVLSPAYMSRSKDVLSKLPKLDVRVSEFVHQALAKSEIPLVYLPLLVEDPSQASAWNVGCDIRTLAYSILVSRKMNVHEYRRKAQAIAIQEVVTYTPTDLPVPIADLERQIRTLSDWAACRIIEPALLWPLFALSLVLAELNTPPPVLIALRVINGDFDNTWEFVHLTARLHAALYSLRMFSQIVQVQLAVKQAGSKNLHDSLVSLDQRMRSLPSIPNGFGVPGQTKRVLADHDQLRALIEEIYVSAGVDVPIEHVSNKKKKRQTREAERKKKKAEQRLQPKQQMKNAYTLLGDSQS